MRIYIVYHNCSFIITANVTDTYTFDNITSPQCMPRKALMRTPFYPYRWSLPSMIEVQRCMGGCNVGIHPGTVRCAVTKLERKNVKVMQVPLMTHKTITITNHLACKCDCKIQPTDCDPIKQIYDKNQCSCFCRSNITCHSLQVNEERTKSSSFW